VIYIITHVVRSLMEPLHALLIVVAGFVAGTMNAVVGSGSLVTFPALLLVGYPPVVANVSNTVGLVWGSVSGAVGYRKELVGQRPRILALIGIAGLGGLTGGALLLVLPAAAFARIVPILILVACLLVAIQPRLTALVIRAAEESPSGGGTGRPGRALKVAVFLTSVYGGYFGAAQGVILISLLAVFIDDDIQRLNALKNVITVVVNGTAAVLFLLTAQIAWGPALLIALGSVVGGQLGAVVGRRLPPVVLRTAIILLGTVVAVRQLLSG
jgi:uncharacterized membrane protein YfcA